MVMTSVETTGEAEPIKAEPTKAAPAVSTLIEFPGAAQRPQWRKDLSERVREIQERRARETQERIRQPAEQPAPEVNTPQLGLVPQPDQPKVNPIVAAALQRIARAHQPQPRTRSAMSGAAVAVARVAEEQYQVEEKIEARLTPVPALEPFEEQSLPDKQTETARERTLTVVPAQPIEKTVKPLSAPVSKQIVVQPVEEQTVEDDALETTAFEDFYDDRAPVFKRLAASLIDLLVIAFASSPFAAIIELTNGDWADERVIASTGGILVIVMFLYLTTSTALAGRTWGMSLVSLRAVDVDTGLPPTTRQSVTRAIAYMLSLATLGLGILYALFDAEGRTAHDHLSGTAVVRE
jgi:uncharacterized RDD family membrane protein YckC